MHRTFPRRRLLFPVELLTGVVFLAALFSVAAPAAQAQSSAAALEFSVSAAPTQGRPEKVMQQPFFLLTKSLKEIEALAREETRPPDLNAFVDELPLSDGMKAWMKKHQRVKLDGDDLAGKLTVDDLLDIPEFQEAYITHNLPMVGLGFPKRKAKLTDREKNPEKWEASEKRFWEEVRTYIILHPESKDGLGEQLLEKNPVAGWNARQKRHEDLVRQQALALVHSRYLARRAETDLEGTGRITGVPAGRYWFSSLWNEARAGDVRLRWELPVELRAGETLRLELNNANALLPPVQP